MHFSNTSLRSRGSHSAEINSNASSSNTPATHTSMSSRENEVNLFEGGTLVSFTPEDATMDI